MKHAFKSPTKREIMRARDTVNVLQIDHDAMKDWTWQCWHTDEVYIGILIGLQIAENRRKKAKPATEEQS